VSYQTYLIFSKRLNFFTSDSSKQKVHTYGKSTSISILRKHLYIHHLMEWVAECKKLNLTIKAKDALEAIAAFQGTQAEPQDPQRQQFTPEHFVNALAEFIVATDQVYFHFQFYFSLAYYVCLQPLSIMESKEFRKLLLLLRGSLQEKDIPHRTTMRTRILELQKEQAEDMSDQMLVSLLNLLLILN
jgi:hypothetical protein